MARTTNWLLVMLVVALAGFGAGRWSEGEAQLTPEVPRGNGSGFV